MSPELFYEEKTQSSDVWAWGCTAYEVPNCGDRYFSKSKLTFLRLQILTGSIPYAAARNDIAVFSFQFMHILPGSIGRIFDWTSSHYTDAVVWEAVQSSISQSWKLNPHERPRFCEIKECISSHDLESSDKVRLFIDRESTLTNASGICRMK